MHLSRPHLNFTASASRFMCQGGMHAGTLAQWSEAGDVSTRTLVQPGENPSGRARDIAERAGPPRQEQSPG